MDDFQQEPQMDEEVQPSAEATEENVNPEVQEVEAQESEAEGTEGEQQEDKVTFDDKQQAKVNELIGEKVAKSYEYKRQAEEHAQEVARLKAQMPQPEAPVVPEVPNPDDFYGDETGFHAAMRQRDEAIAQRASFDAQANYERNMQEQQRQAEVMKQRQEEAKTIDTYAGNAAKLGISGEQMQQDAGMVSQAIRSPELESHILAQDSGPLIVNYLARNVMELENVRTMAPIQAALYIDNVIKPKLSASARKETAAPKPPEIIQGGSAPEKMHEAVRTATFE